MSSRGGGSGCVSIVILCDCVSVCLCLGAYMGIYVWASVEEEVVVYLEV